MWSCGYAYCVFVYVFGQSEYISTAILFRSVHIEYVSVVISFGSVHIPL